MALVSTLELPGSPAEVSSTAPATAFYWNDTAELQTGETLSAPVCTILEYDPRYPLDTEDVTATVQAAGSPAIVASGVNAGDVSVTIKAASLTAGYEYRVMLSATGSLGTNPQRYFRIVCKL